MGKCTFLKPKMVRHDSRNSVQVADRQHLDYVGNDGHRVRVEMEVEISTNYVATYPETLQPRSSSGKRVNEDLDVLDAENRETIRQALKSGMEMLLPVAFVELCRPND